MSDCCLQVTKAQGETIARLGLWIVVVVIVVVVVEERARVNGDHRGRD